MILLIKANWPTRLITLPLIAVTAAVFPHCGGSTVMSYFVRPLTSQVRPELAVERYFLSTGIAGMVTWGRPVGRPVSLRGEVTTEPELLFSLPKSLFRVPELLFHVPESLFCAPELLFHVPKSLF